ncbi:MAG: M1 family metallopeptidase [Sphingomonadales bacterium]
MKLYLKSAMGVVAAAALGAVLVVSAGSGAEVVKQTKNGLEDKFRQLEEVLPTPNIYRTGSGAPGHGYWQQKVDYNIRVSLDEKKKTINGWQRVTYTNNSPDTLSYIWLQMDQNRFSKHSEDYRTRTNQGAKKLPFRNLRSAILTGKHDGGFKIGSVTDTAGRALRHTVVETVMRIDLDEVLEPGQTFEFEMNWSYNIVEAKAMGARGGWEDWKDGNTVFFISQFHPRLSVYTDAGGWNTKKFLGAGEFTLEFGDFEVEITVPADHVVASTGDLMNPGDVLSKAQRKRLKKAAGAERPVFIVTPEEALKNEKKGTKKTVTWRFSAGNVRDFAFASSRKFVWDAMGYTRPSDGGTVMAMSFYPVEGIPLWDKYSTHAIHHTLETYGKYAFEYPYSKAQSVLGPIGGGMEYPMITSNGPRPDIAEDGTKTYSRRAKYGLISVVIHEIGHSWFPMIVDSDERNWTWMDEGLNSFLQGLSEQEWEVNYPTRRLMPKDIVTYMISSNQVPIMTQSDSLLKFGNNAYAKPATALNILRETIMGRELFDFAFKEYSNRWKFKRPFPADFFRTMEDASGIDLDWFWRGWFYTTDHVDISISRVTRAVVDTKDPEIEEPAKREVEKSEPRNLTRKRNEGMKRRVERFPELKDFYNENDKFTVTGEQRRDFERYLTRLEDWEKELLQHGGNIYFVEFENIGGLVMPLILEIEYADGKKEVLRLPAEIWRRDSGHVTRPIITDREIVSIILDPNWEIADADQYNNAWPRKPVESRVELFKRKRQRNLMKHVEDDKKRKEEKAGKKAKGKKE